MDTSTIPTTPIVLEFSQENTQYLRQPNEYNFLFLRSIQAFATDSIQANGHLFLNELLDMLGFQRTIAGQVLGWTADRDKQATAAPLFDYMVDEHRKIWVTITTQGDILEKAF